MDTHLYEFHRGVELDVVSDIGSWSLRIAEQVDGALSVVVVDHLAGRTALAELLEQDRP